MNVAESSSQRGAIHTFCIFFKSNLFHVWLLWCCTVGVVQLSLGMLIQIGQWHTQPDNQLLGHPSVNTRTCFCFSPPPSFLPFSFAFCNLYLLFSTERTVKQQSLSLSPVLNVWLWWAKAVGRKCKKKKKNCQCHLCVGVFVRRLGDEASVRSAAKITSARH